jgi:hypothetical protein
MRGQIFEGGREERKDSWTMRGLISGGRGQREDRFMGEGCQRVERFLGKRGVKERTDSRG